MIGVAFYFVLIVLSRVIDVSLGTVRTIMVVQGRRTIAFVLGFFEVLIWVLVVSRVIQELDKQPVYAVAYAVGFALGNYVGMAVEHRLALGRQVLRVVTRVGPEMAAQLREAGMRVTQFDGYGRDGPVQELSIQVERRRMPALIRLVRAQDPKCYYIVDDVRAAWSADMNLRKPGWRAFMAKR